ncbi:MAG: DUF6679 family protein [Cyanobacteria bacterium J06649_4]
MLQRKLYKLSAEGCRVQIYLRDQQRWIEAAIILSIESDLVTLQYTQQTHHGTQLWEEMVRIESIGSVSRKISETHPETLTQKQQLTSASHSLSAQHNTPHTKSHTKSPAEAKALADKDAGTDSASGTTATAQQPTHVSNLPSPNQTPGHLPTSE